MKKTERLNHMIRYLNDFDHFNLKDLMKRYGISKSTALRDIQSLEEMGMPIYSEPGRYGRYGILKKRLLSPILFTMEEVFTLYFSMQTINDYQSTPFHVQAENLNEKFNRCLSEKQQRRITRMKRVLAFESHQYTTPCRFLDRVLAGILNDEVSRISYQKDGADREFRVKFFRISARFGQWYANGVDTATDEYRVFRCDKIVSIEAIDLPYPHSVDSLLDDYPDRSRSGSLTEFRVEITEEGRDIFYKEHYPGMELVEGEKIQIRGSYGENEKEFISQYLLGFGTHIISIRPQKLKVLVQERISFLGDFYRRVL